MTYGFLRSPSCPSTSRSTADPALVQAARGLYASGRAAFLHVTLPLTMPGITRRGDPHLHPLDRRLRDPGPARRRPDDDDRQDRADAVHVVRDWPYGAALGFLLIVVTIAGTLAGLRFLRREVIGDADAQPVPGGFGTRLRVPVLADRDLILFSFNDSKRNFAWRGFTLKWYPELFGKRSLLSALWVTLQVALISVIVTTIWHAAGAGPGPPPERASGEPRGHADPAADGDPGGRHRHQPAAVLRPADGRQRVDPPDRGRPHRVLDLVRRDHCAGPGGLARPADGGGGPATSAPRPARPCAT